MKVWITKYALSQGIYTHDNVEVCADINPNMIHCPGAPGEMASVYHGKEWWKTEAEARAQAEKMRKDKIESLKKAIAKLEKLKF